MSEDEKTEPEVKETPVIKVKSNWLAKNWLVFCLVLVVVILGSYVGYGAYGNYKDKNSAKSSLTATASATTTATVVASKTDRIVDEGVTWIDPLKLSDLGLFAKSSKSEEMNAYQSTDYYKVGYTAAGKDIILAKVKVSGMGDFYSYQRFLKSGDTYSRLLQNSDKLDTAADTFDGSGYTEDSTTVFKSILPDDSIVDGKTKLAYEEWGTRTVEIATADPGSKVGSTKWGDLYRVNAEGIKDSVGNDISYVKAARYSIVLNDSTKRVYSPTGSFIRDDNTFDLEFTTDTEKASSYKFNKLATGGCGLGAGSFPLLTDESKISGKKLLGKNGIANVYYVDDTSSDIVKFGYEMYKVGRNASEIKSIDEFVSNYGVVFWKDAYDSTIIFMNSDWSPQAECGKPVVYLYPEKETNISVKVGAKITKSEPEYGNGWNVTAEPNGELKLAGQTYPYLFWEGLGFGQYPAISSGNVVAKADVASTIESQLRQIGLNAKEIADFNEFWLPKMPSKPYVRLTWLQNNQMNELAPLKITPAPKSLIRVFLDFRGYDQKPNIPAQQLISYPRDGYTAVEWGGLLVK